MTLSLDRSAVYSAYAAGYSCDQIARRVGASKSCIHRRLRKWGACIRSPGGQEGRARSDRDAHAARNREHTVSAIPWEGHRANILTALQAGATLASIAARLEVSEPVLSRRLTRLGIRRVWVDMRDGK